MRLKSKALKLFLSVVMSIFLVPGIAAAAAPTFTSAAMDHAYGDNYVRLLVVFSEGVCGDSGGMTPITKEDFVLSVKTNGGYITGASINNIMNSSNNNPEPGDTHFFFNVNLVGGPPSGVEQITIEPSSGSSVYSYVGDPDRVPMDALESCDASLPDKRAPQFSNDPIQGETQAAGSKTVKVLVQSSEAQEIGLAYVVLPAGDPAPDAEEVFNQQDGDGNSDSVLDTASMEWTPGAQPYAFFTGQLPADGTTYEMYLILYDFATPKNLSDIKTLSVTTPGPPGPACKIVDTGVDYPDLDSAIGAVTEGQTILLLSDITDTNGISLSGKKFKLDMNGKDLNIQNVVDSGLELKLSSELEVIGSGNLNISSNMAGLDISESEFTTSDETIVDIESTTNAGISAYYSTVDIKGTSAVDGVTAGINAGSNNTITVSGTVSVNGTANNHAVHVSNTGNTISVGSAIVSTGSGAGVYIENGGTVTVGSETNPGQVVGKGNGIWIAGLEGGTVTVYGNVEGGANGIYFPDKSDITIRGNVKSTSSLSESCGVRGYVNSDKSSVDIQGNVEGVNGVYIHGADSEVTITGTVTATGMNSNENYGVRASYAKVDLTGNIAANACTGARSDDASEITMEGSIWAAQYIKVKNALKGSADYDAVSAKPGYLQYSSEGAYVWVKAPSDTTPPEWMIGFPDTFNVQDTDLILEVAADENCTVYYVILTDGSADPSSGQVEDRFANTVSGGNFSYDNAPNQKNHFVGGLTPETAYDLWVVLKDTAGNLQAEPKRLDVTTKPETDTGTGGPSGGSSKKKAEVVVVEEPEVPQAPAMVIVLTPGSGTALVNGQETALDAAPFINPETARAMVPIRFVSEQLGAYVEWLPDTRQVKITLGDMTIILTIGSNQVLVNGVPVEIDAPAEIVNGRTYVPLRFVSETLGATAEWDEVTQTITITK